jgi:hypothetical protein
MLDFLKKRSNTSTEKPSKSAIDDKYSPKFPSYCKVCGSELVWVVEENGFWEDNGERRYRRWLKCPNWKGGQTMFPRNAYIVYTALELNRDGTDWVPRFGYTRYQTCDSTIIY